MSRRRSRRKSLAGVANTVVAENRQRLTMGSVKSVSAASRLTSFIQRVAAEPRQDLTDDSLAGLARQLAPDSIRRMGRSTFFISRGTSGPVLMRCVKEARVIHRRSMSERP